MSMQMDLGAIVWVFVVVGLGAVVFLSLASRDGSPDPSGDRPRSIYLHTVMFITLFLAVFGVFRTVEGIFLLVTAPADLDLHDPAFRQIAAGWLLAIAAGGVFRLHRARAHPYSAETGYAATPGGRVALVYFFLGCFAAVAVGIAGVLGAVDQLLDLIWPQAGIFAAEPIGTGASIGRAVVLAGLGLLMWALYRAYWTAADRGRSVANNGPDPVRVGMAEAADLAESMAVEDDPPQE